MIVRCPKCKTKLRVPEQEPTPVHIPRDPDLYPKPGTVAWEKRYGYRLH